MGFLLRASTFVLAGSAQVSPSILSFWESRNAMQHSLLSHTRRMYRTIYGMYRYRE